MKKIFIYLLIILCYHGAAQNNSYSITGKIDSYNHPSKIILWYLESGERWPNQDTSDLKDGKFQFRGSVKEPLLALLILLEDAGQRNTKSESVNFFLDNSTITITSRSGPKEAEIKGSPANNDYVKLASLTQKYDAGLQNFMTQYITIAQKDATSNEAKDLKSKIDKLQKEKKTVLVKFIEENPDSYVSLFALTTYGGPRPNADEVGPLFYKLSEKLRQSNKGKELFELMEATSKTRIGSTAPDFAENDPDGKLINLSSFKGKYVLIDFWAAWCVPCRKQNPELVKIYNDYKGKQFTVLGVSFDMSKKNWIEAIEKDKLEWTQVSDLKMMHESEVAKLYGIQAIPQNLLIDPEGKIIAKNLSGEALKKKLKELLN